MVFKLYGHPQAANTKRVAVVLHEKQIPYEAVFQDFNTQLKEDAWTSKQPFGQMPYIDDDGFILYESRAIAYYISFKWVSSGTQLVPQDPRDLEAMALLHQAMSVEAMDWHFASEGLATEKLVNRYTGMETNPVHVKLYETTLSARMDGFEKILSKQRYIGGDTLTIADLFFLPYGDIVCKIGYAYLTNESKYPHVAKWWRDISGLASWQKVKDGIPKSL